MENALTIAFFLPLIGFLILLFGQKNNPRRIIAFIACLSVFLSFIFFSLIAFNFSEPIRVKFYEWITLESLPVSLEIHLDKLSLLMTLIITGIGFLIHIYSIGYMDHEEDLARYFAYLNFFIFAMLLLVLASNLTLLFVGWEGVGLASYLLIGFWYKRPEAAQAATKAFIVNRVGDLGFILGLVYCFYIFGTSDITQVIVSAKNIHSEALTILTLLFFIGAMGKSAQMPLHTWLPDAMEGPTPVSALIHAATMVTAGIYLIVRLDPVYLLAPNTLQFIGFIGILTALYAAFCASGQTDLKRVLAYSTVSQLGFMFLACSVGAFYIAMFHLTMHAFMKSLLFLSAGNVVHMLQGQTEMEKMGGLAKKFVITHWLFLIGVLSMAGIPPLAAFFSKDLIVEIENIRGLKIYFYLALLTSLLTSFYLVRSYLLTFYGKLKTENEAVHEAPSIMVLPLFILAGFSILGGFLGFGFDYLPVLEKFLEPIGITSLEKDLTTHFHLTFETVISIVVAFVGIFIAIGLYKRHKEALLQSFKTLKEAFYVNDLYDYFFVKPLYKLAQFFNQFMEIDLFQRTLLNLTNSTVAISKRLQLLQTGQIRNYFAWLILGSTFMLCYFLFDSMRK